MSTTEEQIEDIQKEIRKTPYHKGTEHYIGKLRAKLSKLKDRHIEETVISKGGGGGGYAVKKQGDATIVLVGPPSAGKSTLLNKLTNAKSRVAPYSFTTVSVIPGMMEYNGAKIQILDVPGLIEGAEEGKGRGREVLSIVRGADLLIIISDIKRTKAVKRIIDALENNGIRVNKTKPKIKIEKKMAGGMTVISNIKQEFEKETVKEIAKEYRLGNAEITLREKVSLDQLIDSFSKSRVYVPAIVVINKSDLGKAGSTPSRGVINISAKNDVNLDKLRKAVWKKLAFTKVYLVKRDEEPNKDNPIIMKKGDTLKDVVNKISSEMAEDKENAKIWGPGAKFEGQVVSLTKEIKEGMKIRFI